MKTRRFKLLSVLLTLTLVAGLLSTTPAYASASEIRMDLSFVPTDVAYNDGFSVMYVSDKESKNVYSIDMLTFNQKTIAFDLSPESIFYSDGKLYVSLCTQPHSSYWRDEDHTGAFAIIDCDTFTKTAQYSINVDPYDIVVSNDGIIYIASGSGQWTSIYAFKDDGTVLSSYGIRQASIIEYNSLIDRIYTITTDLSLRDMTAYLTDSDGLFTDSYECPYPGDYAMKPVIQISPDGEYIFNGSGSIFACDINEADDMIYVSSLYKSWTNLAFNETLTSFYTAQDNRKLVYEYRYDTFEDVATYETQGYPQYIAAKGNTLTIISKDSLSGGEYFIETIDLTAPKPTIGTTITTNTLLYQDGRALLSATTNTKTVFTGNMMYIADGNENAVYAIDAAGLTETKIAFPSSLSGINSLYYDNGELFAGFGSEGIVAILDTATYTVVDRLVLGTVFFDVACGKDGFIYVIENFGSFATSHIRSYSRASGQEISSHSSYPRNGKLVPHPIHNMFYWADIGTSPPDINAMVYQNGIIQDVYDSPQHSSTISIGSRIRISPDGLNIFASAGNVFRSSNTKSADMLYKEKFVPFTDLVFDLPNNMMFGSQSRKNLVVYEYDTLDNIGFIKTVLPVKEMVLNGSSIIALSSDNNDYYLEVLNSNDVLQVMPEEMTLGASNTVFMTTGGTGSTVNLNPILIYNDGTSKSVKDSASYTSSDLSVVIVNTTGTLTAIGTGYATVTISAEGISASVDVFVNFDITSITVDGNSIGFTPSKTSYVVVIPEGTATLPNVEYEAPSYVNVTVTQATDVPGFATIVVTDGSGMFTKTYTVYFEPTEPDLGNIMPFIIRGHFLVINGEVYLEYWIEDNPDYPGTIPSDFYVVMQLISSDGEPIHLIATDNTRHSYQWFSADYVAIIMVVDKFGENNYIGFQLAVPRFG